MSEMVRQRGVIKKLSNEDNLTEVYNKLVEDGLHDPKRDELNDDGTLQWIDGSEYEVINGCLFDMSDAPEEDDSEDFVEEGKKLNDTDYDVHLYWYNGSDSPIDDIIKRADEEYERKNVERVQFVELTEYNDHEGETWSFWLQLDNNEAELKKLADLLEDEMYEEQLSLSMTPTPEDEVDILVKHSRGNYMCDHSKITGEFTMPEIPEGYDYDDQSEFYIEYFYKGGIKDSFKALSND